MKHTDKAIKQELEYIEQANNYAVLYCVEKRKYTKRNVTARKHDVAVCLLYISCII